MYNKFSKEIKPLGKIPVGHNDRECAITGWKAQKILEQIDRQLQMLDDTLDKRDDQILRDLYPEFEPVLW